MNSKKVARLILICFIIMAGALVQVGCQAPAQPDPQPDHRNSDRQTTWVVLVRHAEKAGEQGDVPLTDQGHKRAELLAEMLAEADVKAIYATQFLRCQQTCEPLSQKTGVPITTLSIEGDTAEHVRQLARRLKSKDHAGELIVCVEHSNTIPMILTELGAESIEGYADYPQMFVIILTEGEPAKRIILQYDL